jgi:hypothetical protein
MAPNVTEVDEKPVETKTETRVEPKAEEKSEPKPVLCSAVNLRAILELFNSLKAIEFNPFIYGAMFGVFKYDDAITVDDVESLIDRYICPTLSTIDLNRMVFIHNGCVNSKVYEKSDNIDVIRGVACVTAATIMKKEKLMRMMLMKLYDITDTNMSSSLLKLKNGIAFESDIQKLKWIISFA